MKAKNLTNRFKKLNEKSKLKNTEKDFEKWLLSDDGEGLNKNSAEFDLALGQFGSDSEDDLFYKDFLAFIGESVNERSDLATRTKKGLASLLKGKVDPKEIEKLASSLLSVASKIDDPTLKVISRMVGTLTGLGEKVDESLAPSGELLTHSNHKFKNFMVVKSATFSRETGSPHDEDAYQVRIHVSLRDRQGFGGNLDIQSQFIEMFIVTTSSDAGEIQRLKGAYKWPIYSGEDQPLTKAKKEADKLVKKL